MTNEPSEIDILRQMSEVLEDRGWTQHAYSSPNGSVCLIGAYLVVTGHERELEEGFDTELTEKSTTFTAALRYWPVALRDRLFKDAPARLAESSLCNPELGEVSLAASFNDDAFTTEEDIKLILKRSIEDAEKAP